MLPAFFDYPAEHWIHLRTTNPIESTSSTIRLRTKVTRGAGSRTAAVVLHFAIAAHTTEVGGPKEHPELKTHIHVGQPDDTWAGRSHALLYLAKPTSR